MEELMKKIELLAPAKDYECGEAAIDSGADAVYIGAQKFGARAAAGNSLEDIKRLTDYAHKYWAKVYVTINTLIRDNEFDDSLELIDELYKIGIDGLIIQDPGLLEFDLPPIPLIASTQMHNNTPAKVDFLEEAGFKRAILARELDLKQIKAIKDATDIELECFVHGSLCVSYSGQCYFSYGIGRRSGNRGQCAQPCRKQYCLKDANGNILIKDQYLLSLKDLNLSEHIKDLIDAGVTAFKIEGRLKEKTYVSNIVAFYRQKIDEAIKGTDNVRSSSGKSIIDFEPNPEKTFNRGYTTHFLNGRDNKPASFNSSSMIGERIGRVISVGKWKFVLDNGYQLNRGDGICFFNKRGEICGTVVNDVIGNSISPDKMSWIIEDIVIYRNHDHNFLTHLAKTTISRQINMQFLLKETEEGFALIATDEDANKIEIAIQLNKELAQKPEAAKENIIKQLSKTGGSDFNCTGVNLELENAYFIPISSLNQMRRDALEKLMEIRLQNMPKEKSEMIKNSYPYPETKLSYEGNVINKYSQDFYKRHGVTEIEPGAETGISMTGRKIMTNKYCIKHQFDMCPKFSKPCQHVLEPLYLVDEDGHTLELEFDCIKCEMEVFPAPGIF